MTVEDALLLMTHHYLGPLALGESKDIDLWTASFLTSVNSYVVQDRPLSTEQAKIVLKLLARHERAMVKAGVIDAAALAALLRSPVYRQEPYQSANVPREVRYLGGNLLGFRFKRNEAIREDLRKLKPRDDIFEEHRSWFHSEYRIWVVPVTRESLKGIAAIISTHRFDFDDAVVEYLTECENSIGEPSAFVLDPELGILAHIPDNEAVAWWCQSILGGEVV